MPQMDCQHASFEATNSLVANVFQRDQLVTHPVQYQCNNNYRPVVSESNAHQNQYNGFPTETTCGTNNDIQTVYYNPRLMSFMDHCAPATVDSNTSWRRENENATIVLKAFGAELNTGTVQRDQVLEGRLPKRFRTTFSPSQLNRLEHEFQCSNYVVGLKRLRLAEELKLEEKQVKIWFQNKRMKIKRERQSMQRRIMANTMPYCF